MNKQFGKTAHKSQPTRMQYTQRPPPPLLQHPHMLVPHSEVPLVPLPTRKKREGSYDSHKSHFFDVPRVTLIPWQARKDVFVRRHWRQTGGTETGEEDPANKESFVSFQTSTSSRLAWGATRADHIAWWNVCVVHFFGSGGPGEVAINCKHINTETHTNYACNSPT